MGRMHAISSTAVAVIIAVVVTAIVVGVAAYYLAISSAPAAPATPTTQVVTKTVTIAQTTTTPVTVTVTASPTKTTTTTPAMPKSITFYTWWAGLERFAIDALIGNFTKKYGIEVKKTAVPGGAGVNAKFAILALIMAGKPPAAFQVHCGPEMISYFMAAPHKEKDFVDLTSVAKQIDITSTAPGQACMLAGRMYTIPVNLHRANLIFMNKHVLDKYGIKPPTTLDQLVQACKTLAAHGKPCMLQAGADLFTVLHLWEQIFLSVAGPQKFIQFMYGTLSPDDPSIKKATEIFLELSKTFPPNWMSLDWTSAVDALVKGQGAFHVDGDWVVGLVYNVYPNVVMCPIDNIKPNCDIIVAPFPGTQGIYNMVIDAVAVPHGPEEKAGTLFAKFFASRDGQKIFNPLKGSIADYPDIPPDIYPTTIQKWEVKEYKESKYQVFSLTHGALFSDVWQKLLQGAVTLAQTKNTAMWYDTVTKALKTERELWEKSGLYLGTPEKPFAGYLPPWAKK
ncbi:MAG: ABC transporter substrate-binding protein [Pyrodictiaceae archaeon]